MDHPIFRCRPAGRPNLVTETGKIMPLPQAHGPSVERETSAQIVTLPVKRVERSCWIDHRRSIERPGVAPFMRDFYSPR